MPVVGHPTDFSFFETLPTNYAVDKRLIKKIQASSHNDQCLEFKIEGKKNNNFFLHINNNNNNNDKKKIKL